MKITNPNMAFGCVEDGSGWNGTDGSRSSERKKVVDRHITMMRILHIMHNDDDKDYDCTYFVHGHICRFAAFCRKKCVQKFRDVLIVNSILHTHLLT